MKGKASTEGMAAHSRITPMIQQEKRCMAALRMSRYDLAKGTE